VVVAVTETHALSQAWRRRRSRARRELLGELDSQASKSQVVY
jgi:hypothetical protein